MNQIISAAVAEISPPNTEQQREMELLRYRQQRDEVLCDLIEGLNSKFVTRFEFPVVDGRVVSVSGEPVVEITKKDLQQAKQYAKLHPEHAFYVSRSEADLSLGLKVDAMMASDGPNTIITESPFPGDIYKRYPLAVRERNYRPESKRSLVWIHRKLDEETVELTSVTIDGAEFSELIDLHEAISGKEFQGGTEDMPHEPIELSLNNKEFEQLVGYIFERAGIGAGYDSKLEAERIGKDLIDYVTDKYMEIDKSETIEDLSAELMGTVSRLAFTEGSEIIFARINELRSVATGGATVLGLTHKEALKECITYSGWASFKHRMENGITKEYVGRDVAIEMGGIGEIFVNYFMGKPGCPGDLSAAFNAAFEAVFVDGEWLEEYGEERGPGICKGCEVYSQNRGGCELCPSCHKKAAQNKLGKELSKDIDASQIKKAKEKEKPLSLLDILFEQPSKSEKRKQGTIPFFSWPSR